MWRVSSTLFSHVASDQTLRPHLSCLEHMQRSRDACTFGSSDAQSHVRKICTRWLPDARTDGPSGCACIARPFPIHVGLVSKSATCVVAIHQFHSLSKQPSSLPTVAASLHRPSRGVCDPRGVRQIPAKEGWRAGNEMTSRGHDEQMDMRVHAATFGFGVLLSQSK